MASRKGIDYKLERKQSELFFDTRSFPERLRGSMTGELPVVLIAAMGAVIFIFPALAELMTLVAVLFFWYVRNVQRTTGLALRMPKTSELIDPNELSPKDGKPVKAEGIIYLGNDQDTKEEVWLTDNQARTHMLFMGTTGSGKTEYLVSLVYNSLIHGSGFIYVDGKADSSLYGKIYSMARAMGREDDVLVINFQTGARDIYGAQPSKLSNTLNPFAVGSAGMLSELVKGLMATGEKSTWTQQAESFIEALMKPLVYLRDMHSLDLDVDVVRSYFGLNEIEDLAWRYKDIYPGLEDSGVLDGIKMYLKTKPGYDVNKYHNQGETTQEQHGYISMQLIRTFNSMADTYGYIMKTPLAEIDFVDVFLNRRILVVLLPALEKSPTELTNLGRIVVASIKATMAKGLGSSLEGSWKKVISSKPTTAPSPFLCVLDEYGYYAVEGFAVVPAQARSLGFSAVFAGQDLPAFQKASKEEAESTLANTNTKFCGKLECTKTYEFFKDLAGSGYYSKNSSYRVDTDSLAAKSFKGDDSISTDTFSRVSFDSLRGQLSGEWHLFFANTIIRVKSFYANPTPVKNLRVNHFIKVARPEPKEVKAFHETINLFKRAMSSNDGFRGFMDRANSPQDISDIHDGFAKFKSELRLFDAGKVIANCANAEKKRTEDFLKLALMHEDLSDAKSYQGDHPQPPQFDFARRIEKGQRAIPNQVPKWPPESGGADNSRSQSTSGYAEKSITSPAESSDLYETDDQQYEESEGYENLTTYEQREASRAVLMPHTEYNESADADHVQTNVFGVDHLSHSFGELTLENDISPDSADLPQSVDQVEEINEDEEFDAPLTEHGMLNRETTISGIVAIEQRVGAPKRESSQTADAVAETLARATAYPITPPVTKPNIDELERLANELSGLLTDEVGNE
jgi:intracellular multiplication protein IcmO